MIFSDIMAQNNASLVSFSTFPENPKPLFHDANEMQTSKQEHSSGLQKYRKLQEIMVHI